MRNWLVKSLLFFIPALLLASCSFPGFEVIGDEAGEQTVYRLKNLSAKADRDLLGPAGHMEYSLEMRLSWETHDTTFFLTNDVLSIKPVYLDYGDSLVLTLDGKETGLFCSESNDLDDGVCVLIRNLTHCTESGSFELDRSTVAAMAEAKTVEFSINSPDGVYTSTLYEGSHNGVKKFCERYLR